MMKEVILLTGQTVYDLALQEYGHTDGVFMIVQDNPELIGEWGDVPPAGSKVQVRLNIPELSENNKAVAAELARREQQVVTGLPVNYNPEGELYVENGYWNENYTA